MGIFYYGLIKVFQLAGGDYFSPYGLLLSNIVVALSTQVTKESGMQSMKIRTWKSKVLIISVFPPR